MNVSTRSLGFSLLLLLLFLGATLALQWWLGRQTSQLRASAVEEQRHRLIELIKVLPKGAADWKPGPQPELSAVLGGVIEFVPPGVPLSSASGEYRGLTFVHDLASPPGWRAQVKFAGPAMTRIHILQQRALVVTVVLALLVATVPLFLVLIGSRRTSLPEGASRVPWAARQADARGVEHFARISYEQMAAREVEQGARVRAEENLQVNRHLLNRSVEERIRLGRELHDNICQTLYAVCLTLESVQKKNTLAPAMSQRVSQCMVELKRLNQEVRSYLDELEPAQVVRHSFTGALSTMLATFQAEEITIEQRLDESAVANVRPEHIPDVMNLMREAISNSLRHGHAKTISLLAAQSEREVVLAVQDDGAGFDPGIGTGGHGLANMQARARSLGGTLKIESAPGKGTRLLLTLPVASVA